MEKEIDRRIFLLKDYSDKSNMEKHIKDYIRNLKNNYPFAVVTREFCRENGILVRATQIDNVHRQKENNLKENELDFEKEEVRIKEKGINGLGENVDRTIKNGKSREKEIDHGERERGER